MSTATHKHVHVWQDYPADPRFQRCACGAARRPCAHSTMPEGPSWFYLGAAPGIANARTCFTCGQWQQQQPDSTWLDVPRDERTGLPA